MLKTGEQNPFQNNFGNNGEQISFQNNCGKQVSWILFWPTLHPLAKTDNNIRKTKIQIDSTCVVIVSRLNSKCRFIKQGYATDHFHVGTYSSYFLQKETSPNTVVGLNKGWPFLQPDECKSIFIWRRTFFTERCLSLITLLFFTVARRFSRIKRKWGHMYSVLGNIDRICKLASSNIFLYICSLLPTVGNDKTLTGRRVAVNCHQMFGLKRPPEDPWKFYNVFTSSPGRGEGGY